MVNDPFRALSHPIRRGIVERLAAGQPASVKYDPSNPSNSILVADDWSGLH